MGFVFSSKSLVPENFMNLPVPGSMRGVTSTSGNDINSETIKEPYS